MIFATKCHWDFSKGYILARGKNKPRRKKCDAGKYVQQKFILENKNKWCL